MTKTTYGKSKKVSMNHSQWLKNATRSIGTTSVNVIKDMAPTTFETGGSVLQELKDMQNFLTNFNIERNDDNVLNALKDGAKNAIADLKSGNLNNTDREMSAIMGDMNFDDLLSDDGFDFGSESVESSGATSAIGSTEVIANTIIAGAEATYSATKMNATISKHNGYIMSQGLSAINDNLSKIVQFNMTNMNTLVMSSIKYHEESMELLKSIQETRGVPDSNNVGSERDLVENFVGMGKADMGMYRDIVKKNFGEYVDSNMILSLFKSTASDPSMMKMMTANPIGGLMSMSMSAMVPAIFKKSLDAFDKSLEAFLPALFTKVGEMADNYENPISQLFGQIFGIRSDYKKTVDLSNLNLSEAAVFDKMTKRTINEVIPGYLKDIAQALKGGDADVFDHREGRFRKSTAMANEFYTERRRSQLRHYDTDIEDIVNSIKKSGAFKDGKSQDDFTVKLENFFIKNAERGKVMNVSKHSTDLEDMATSAGMSSVEASVLRNIIGNMPKNRVMSLFGGKMTQSRLSNNRFFKELENDPNKAFFASLTDNESKEADLHNEYMNWRRNGNKGNFNTFKAEFNKEQKRRSLALSGISSGIAPSDSIKHSAIEYLKSIEGVLREGITVFVGGKSRGKKSKKKSSSSTIDSLDDGEGPASSTISDDFDLDNVAFLSSEVKTYRDGFVDKFIERNSSGEGIKGIISRLMAKPGELMAKAVGKLDEVMYTAIFGSDSESGHKSFFAYMGDGIENFWNNTQTWLHEKIFEPMKEKLFGEKGLFTQVKQSDPYQWAAGKLNDFKENLLGEKTEDGFRKGGTLSDTANELKDMVKSVGYYFTGNEYTDSKGTKFGKNDKSVFGETGKIFNEFKEGLRNKIFGEKDPNEPEKGFVQSALDGLGQGFANFSEAIFGPKEFSNGKANPRHKAMGDFSKTIKEKLPKGLAFGIVGGTAGLLSGGSMGLLGSLFLPGGPIGGVLVGTAVGMASQSDSVMKFVFGEKDPDGNRIGGLVSKGMQDFAKKNKTAIFGGASVGALKSLILGNGLLTSMFLPGGIVGGAIAGIASGMIYKSEAVQNFLFGKELEDGTKAGGVFSKIMNHFNASGIPGLNKDTMKNLAAGTISGAALSTVIGQMGMVGAMATMGGSPILGALVGAASGIALSSDKWTKAIFGEIDENSGDRKGGLLTKVTNWMNVNLAQPIANKVAEYKLNMEDWFAVAIADPFMSAIDPVMAEIKFVVTDNFNRVKDMVGTVVGKAGAFMKDNIADPMVDAFKTTFLDPLTKSLDKIIKGSAKMIGNVIASPFKLMAWAANGFEKKHEKRGLAHYKDDQWGQYKEGNQGLFSTLGNMYFNKEERAKARTSDQGAYYNADGKRKEEIEKRKEERKTKREEKRAKLQEQREQLKMRQQFAVQMGYDNFDASGKNNKFAYGHNVKFEKDKDGTIKAIDMSPEAETAKTVLSMDNKLGEITSILEPEQKEQTEQLKGIRETITDIFAFMAKGPKELLDKIGGQEHTKGKSFGNGRVGSGSSLARPMSFISGGSAGAYIGGVDTSKVKNSITTIKNNVTPDNIKGVFDKGKLGFDTLRSGLGKSDNDVKVSSKISDPVKSVTPTPVTQNKSNVLALPAPKTENKVGALPVPKLNGSGKQALSLPAPKPNNALALPAPKAVSSNLPALPGKKNSALSMVTSKPESKIGKLPVPKITEEKKEEVKESKTPAVVKTDAKPKVNKALDEVAATVEKKTTEKEEVTSKLSPEKKEKKQKDFLSSVIDDVLDENKEEAKEEKSIEERDKYVKRKNVTFINQERERLEKELAEKTWKDDILATTKGILGALTGGDGKENQFDKWIAAILAALAALGSILSGFNFGSDGWLGEDSGMRTLNDGTYIENGNYRERLTKDFLLKPMAKFIASDAGQAMAKGLMKVGTKAGAGVTEMLSKYVAKHSAAGAANSGKLLAGTIGETGGKILYGEVVDSMPEERIIAGLLEETTQKLNKEFLGSGASQKLITSNIPVVYDPAEAIGKTLGEGFGKGSSKAFGEAAQKGTKAAFDNIIDVEWVEVGAKNVAEKGLKEVSDNALDKTAANFIKALSGGLNSFFKNSTVMKRMGATAAGKAAAQVDSFVIGGLRNAKNITKKYGPKIAKAITEAAASMGITITTAGLVDIAFGTWDGITGMMEAANLFKTANEDVDFKMRIVSGIMKLLFGLGFVGPLIDVAAEIIEEFTGVGFKSSVAEIIYRCMADESEAEALDQAQAAFEADFESWKAETGNDHVRMAGYNDMVNKTVFQRYISDPWKNFWEDPVKSAGGVAVDMATILGGSAEMVKYGPKAYAEKALKPLTDSKIGKSVGKFLSLLGDAIKIVFNKLTSKVGGTKAGQAASVVIEKLSGAVNKMKSSPDLLKKFFPRLTQAMTEAAASMGISIASAGLVDLGFAVWDGSTGASVGETANLFKVAGDDVDITMRLISGTMKILFGMGFVGPLFDVAVEIYEDLSGHGFKSMIAELLYDILSPEEKEGALDEAQAKFQDAYNSWLKEDGNEGKTLQEYNDETNRSIFQKYIADPFNNYIAEPIKQHVLEPMGKAWDNFKGSVSEGISWAGDKIKQGIDGIIGGVKLGVDWIWNETPVAAFNTDQVRETLGMDSEENVQLKHRIATFAAKNPFVKMGTKVANLFGIDVDETDVANTVVAGWDGLVSKMDDFKVSIKDGINRGVEWITNESPLAAFNTEHVKSLMGEDTDVNLKHRISVGLGNLVTNIGNMFGADIDSDTATYAVAGTIQIIEEKAIDTWNNIKDTTSEWYTTAKNNIGNAVKTADENVGKWLGLTDNDGNPLSLTGHFKHAWDETVSWGKEVFEETRVWTETGVQNIKTFFSDAKTNIPTAIEAANQNIGKWLGLTDDNGNPLSLTSGVSYGWNNVVTWGQDMWNNASVWWDDSIATIKGNMSNLGDNIKSSLKPMDDMLGKMFGFVDPETGEQLSLSGGVGHSFSTVREKIKSALTSSGEYLEKIADKAKEIGTDIGKNVSSAVKQFDKMIGSFLGFTDKNGNPMSLSEAGKATWSAIMDIPKTIGNMFKDAVKSAQDAIDDFIQGAIKKGKEFFNFGNGNGGNSGGYGLGSFSELLNTSITVNNYDHGTVVNKNYSNNTTNNSTSNSPAYGNGPDDGFVYYTQNDPRWSNKKYGYSGSSVKNSKFADRGCGPTAMAMVASQLTGDHITPDETADLALRKNMSKPSGTHWDYIPVASREYGINSKGLQTNESTIRSELQSGRPVILSGQKSSVADFDSPYTTSGHYVVATGYKNGKVKVNDPNGYSGNRYYDLNKVADQANVAWSFENRNDDRTTGDIGEGTYFQFGNMGHFGFGNSAAEKVVASARKLIGKPYILGGNYSPLGNSKGTDCSGLCQWSYNDALGSSYKTLFGSRWTTSTIYADRNNRGKVKKNITNAADLRPGDLVLCNYSGGRYKHVVLWIGNGKYIHAPSPGKTITEGDYWVTNNKSGKWEGLRVLEESQTSDSTTDSSADSSSDSSSTYTQTPYVPFENDPLGELGARIGEVYGNYAMSALTGKEYKEIDWTKAPGVAGMVQEMMPGTNNNSGSDSSGSDGADFGTDDAGQFLKNFHYLSAVSEVGDGTPKSIPNLNAKSGFISSGAGDYGGKSYGVTQLSSKMGSLRNFVNWLKGAHPDLYSPLSGKTIAGSSFDSAWKGLASEKFKLAQWEFIDNNFFNPGLKVANNKGVKNTDKITMKSIINAASTQRGTGGSFPGVMSAGANTSNLKDSVSKMYDYMINNVNSHFRSSSSSVKSGVQKRFVREKGYAVKMAEREMGGNGGFGLGGSDVIPTNSQVSRTSCDNLYNKTVDLGRRNEVKVSAPKTYSKPQTRMGMGSEASKSMTLPKPTKINTPSQMTPTETPEVKAIINNANIGSDPTIILERVLNYLSMIAQNTDRTATGVANIKIESGSAPVSNTIVATGGNKQSSNMKNQNAANKSNSRMQKAMAIASGRF